MGGLYATHHQVNAAIKIEPTGIRVSHHLYLLALQCQKANAWTGVQLSSQEAVLAHQSPWGLFQVQFLTPSSFPCSTRETTS